MRATEKILNKKYSAFNLTEVIIVLIILGFIAVIVYSNIKNIDYNEKAGLAKANKVLRELENATTMIMLNHSRNGTMLNLVAEDGTLFKGNDRTNFADKHEKLGILYKKYLEATRKDTSTNALCTGHTFSSTLYTYGSAFYLKDGTCIVIINASKENTTIFPGDSEPIQLGATNNAYFRIFYDINGPDGPNEYGKDMFTIPINKYGVDHNPPVTTSSSSSGEGE